MSTKVVSVSPINTTTNGLAGTLNSPMDLAAQNDQLWSIISKQRNVIKDLELALENMTKDRDTLLLLKKQPTTPSPSPTPPQEPVPPPRSPFRQHQHYHSHDGSATLIGNGSTVSTTTTIRHRSSSSTLGGVESPIAITSPIHAILDKDAQLFAKYQQATKKQLGSTNNSSIRPHNVRRALSQPHLMVTASTSEQNSFFSNITFKVLDINIQQNVKNNPVVVFIISVCNNNNNTNRPISTSSISMDNSKEEGDIGNEDNNHSNNNNNNDDDDDDGELWRIKKVYSDFVTLDTMLRSQIRTLVNSKNCIVKIGKLPERSQFTTHGSSAKMDQKKLIEKYLARAIRLPVPEKTDLVQFLSSDVFEQGNQPNPLHHRMKTCQKEGYLSLHGKRPGVWHSYYFMLHGSTLDYYDSKGGLLMGSIQVTDAQITVQHPSPSGTSLQHASHQSTLTIIEKKIFNSSPNLSHQHTLCMESELELDEWTKVLSILTQPIMHPSSPTCIETPTITTATSNKHESPRNRVSKDQIKQLSAPVCPMNQNRYGKFTTRQYIQSTTPHYQPQRSNSDTSIHPGEPNHSNNSILLRGSGNDPIYRHVSSMDNSALCTLESPDHTSSSRPDHLRQRSSLDAIFYTNHREQDPNQQSPTSISIINGNIINSNNNTIKSNDINNRNSSEGDAKKPKSRTRSNRRTFWPKKIFSGNGNSNNDTAGVFRGFLSRHSSDDAASHSTKQLSLASHHQIQPFNLSPYQDNKTTNLPTSPVFGVPLEEAVRISKISDTYELPAIVYRCIEFLENKNAIFEEGIYRLSGSAVKIKALRNEFDEKGDVDLLASEEHQDCDIHAVSGLLKLWLRELPSNVLTEKLLKEFLPIIDFTDRDDCVNELGRLISMLPLANYTLLRALTAHLLRVVQNADTNKMTLRNMGIVFSPTLGIPTGIFNLFLCEFDYIFWTMEPTVLSTTSLPATPTPTMSPSNPPDDRFTDSDSNKNSFEDTSSIPFDAIHPTQIEPLPCGKTPRPRHWHQDQTGRSNRNSVQYTDGAPECMVGMERHCHEGVVDQVEDMYLLDLQETHEDNSDNDDDDDDDDMEDFDDLTIHNIPQATMMDSWKMTSGQVS